MSADLSPTAHLFRLLICGSGSYFMRSVGVLNMKGVGVSRGGCRAQHPTVGCQRQHSSEG